MTVSDRSYDDSPSSPGFRAWLIVALILSLGLHIAFLVWAKGSKLSNLTAEYYEKVVPRTFHLDRVDIDPKLLAPDPAETRSVAMAPQAVKLPDEQPAFEQLLAETRGPAAAPRLDQSVLSEKPSAAATTLDQTIQAAEQSGARSVLEDSVAIREALLKDKPGAASPGLTDLLKPDSLTGRAVARAGALSGGQTPGFSNLDDLLARTGPLTPETAPILMPTDLLFDYDRAELRPEAMASLEKLGTLIRRNPQSIFRIEGHTDSFGPDAYNLELSQRRADMVKDWLLGVMNIPAGRVQSIGFGKSRLISAANGTIEQQQINRRVEIVILNGNSR